MSQIKLNYLSATRVHGNDAESFLHSQLTADLTKLGSREACFAAFCQPTGNVLAVLLVVKQDDGLILIAAAELMDGLIRELSRFILRADVHFDRLDHAILGCMDSGKDNEKAEGACVTPRATTLQYCIATTQADSQQGTPDPVASNRWRERELQAGLVWLNNDTTGQFIPQMIGLEKLDGLSFRKGCFPGQEVIARVRYLGKLKRRPFVVEIEGVFDFAAGTKLDLLDTQDVSTSAIVVDSVSVSGITTVFLIARISEESAPGSVLLENRRLELKTPVQT